MESPSVSPWFLRERRPSRAAGVLVAVAGVAAATVVVYPLKHIAPVVSLGVVYVLAVVVVSMFWGLAFGVGTAVLSVAAFSYFHLPPVGRFTLADSGNWIGLSAFVVVAAATGLVADLARAEAREADQRRREAGLAAELAQVLLGATRLEDALALAAQRVAETAAVESAVIELGRVEVDTSQLALALRHDGIVIGTLVLPVTLSGRERSWVLERVVPSLESILAAALHRTELQAEVVETAALRRSDEMKTALLRSVSHDLRTPVTTILTAAGALDPERPTPRNVGEVRELVTDAGTRLWLLIEKLLDLSLLQAGRLEPALGSYSIEEVLREAIEQTGSREAFRLSVDRELPLLRGDPGQLERAFANVLENGARYSAGKPVSVRARVVGERVRVRVVDQGPGIQASEHERVFLPFYRSEGASSDHHGSGLGLAIAKGFVEVNGGRIAVESVPGQGTSFVIDFPLCREEAPPGPRDAMQPVGS
jgi:two-component system, OmpR family, sensor histidine kinase KdpD